MMWDMQNPQKPSLTFHSNMWYTPSQGGTQDGLWQERKHLIPIGFSKKP
jgi:hypothetical protein